MDEVYLRALLEHATSEEPSMGQLVENSLHAGKRLARRRRIEAAIAAVVGIAVIGFAVPAALGALGHNPSHHAPPATHPSRPRGTAYAWTITLPNGYGASHALTVVRLRDGKALAPVRLNGELDDVLTAPDGRTLYAFTDKGDGAQYFLTPISTATDKAGRAIKLSIDVPETASFEIAPNGRFADGFLVSGTRTKFVSMNLRTGAWREVVALSTVNTEPTNFAVTPDGRTAYVAAYANGIFAVNLAKGTVLPIRLPGGQAVDVAITPNGKTAYATSRTMTGNSKAGTGHTETWVTPIDVATNNAGTSIKVRAQHQDSSNIAITPDGRTAYLYGGPNVVPVSLRSGRVLRPIFVANENWVEDLVISPNGKTAYALPGSGFLLPISTRTNKALSPVYLPAGYTEGGPGEAFDASGEILYQPAYIAGPTGANEGVLIPIDTATQQVGKIIKVGRGITEQVVIVP
jgi:hypothetical protein